MHFCYLFMCQKLNAFVGTVSGIVVALLCLSENANRGCKPRTAPAICAEQKESMYRPLSPHISIYKAQMSSTFSVFHRATGIILTLGLLLFFIFFKFFLTYHVTYYPAYFLGYYANTYFAWVFIGILLVLAQSFFWHIIGGIRHLLWDFFPDTNLSNRIDRKTARPFLFSLFSLAALVPLVPLAFC
jgi:succinate dehydrogenase / fumarate reductase cytochrome b subunit